MSLITEEQVVLDLTGADRHEATRRLGERLVASGRCTDLDTFLADVRKREETMATGLPGGIGIPHARSTRHHRAVARLRPLRRRHRLGRQGRPGHPDLPHRGARGRR